MKFYKILYYCINLIEPYEEIYKEGIILKNFKDLFKNNDKYSYIRGLNKLGIVIYYEDKRGSWYKYYHDFNNKHILSEHRQGFTKIVSNKTYLKYIQEKQRVFNKSLEE